VGILREVQPVKLFVGLLAGSSERLAAAEALLVACYGAVDVSSAEMPFGWTNYYADEMGEGLLRKFLAFERLIAPDGIAEIKRETNAMEDELTHRFAGGPARPVNLDPGYLSLSKVILATTKDYSHRLYLGGGIYAEVTLHFHKGRYEPWEWTYPDYRSAEYGEFFTAARGSLAGQLRKEAR
jgi:hypothetical protein